MKKAGPIPLRYQHTKTVDLGLKPRPMEMWWAMSPKGLFGFSCPQRVPVADTFLIILEITKHQGGAGFMKEAGSLAGCPP